MWNMSSFAKNFHINAFNHSSNISPNTNFTRSFLTSNLQLCNYVADKTPRPKASVWFLLCPLPSTFFRAYIGMPPSSHRVPLTSSSWLHAKSHSSFIRPLFTTQHHTFAPYLLQSKGPSTYFSSRSTVAPSSLRVFSVNLPHVSTLRCTACPWESVALHVWKLYRKFWHWISLEERFCWTYGILRKHIRHLSVMRKTPRRPHHCHPYPPALWQNCWNFASLWYNVVSCT